METTGGGRGAANSGAGNDDGGADEIGPDPIVDVGPLDEAEGEGGVGREWEEELLFTLEPAAAAAAAAAGECDRGAPAEDAPTGTDDGIVGGHPGGPAGGKLLLLLVVVLLPAASEGLG